MNNFSKDYNEETRVYNTEESSDNDTDSDNDNDNDENPPPPAAAAMLIAADNVEKSTLTIREPDVVPATSYIPTQSIINIFSWLGSSLYSLATLPSKVVYPQVEEYDHEQVLSTIQKLNNHLTFLDKKIDKMNSNTNRFGEKAKTLYKMKNVKGAMHQIRLKKMYDREIEKLESLKFNIETQILHMDSVEIMMVTVDTIKDTSEYYQSVNSNINITKLENTIDEMVEHRDSSTDIQSILSDINTFNEQSYDDDDLLKELQEMADSEEDNVEKPVATVTPERNAISSPNLTVSLSNLPVAPTHVLPNIRSGTKCRPIRNDEMAL